MALTITPTVDLASRPPRVQLAVEDDAGLITEVTVLRVDPDGVRRPVRTTDGNPLPLSVSGGSTVGTVDDYEAPYGESVHYTTEEQPTVTSAAVTVEVADIWLIHPGVPSLSQTIELRIGSHEDEVFGVTRGIYRPQGRKFPIVATSGARWAGSSSLVVSTESSSQLAGLRGVLADASVLLLNVPPSLELGIDTAYISVDATRARRPSSIGTDPLRDIELPYDVVDRPDGGTRAAWAMGDIRDTFATMADIRDAFPTMVDIAAGV